MHGEESGSPEVRESVRKLFKNINCILKLKTEENNIIYSSSDIEKYWKGELSAAEMHRMEKAALDDPFLADAMEGYEKAAEVNSNIADLQKRLATRVGEEDKKVVAMPRRRWMMAAAVFVLLAGIGAVLYFNNHENSVEENLVLAQRKQEAPAAKSDSVSSTTPEYPQAESIAAMSDTSTGFHYSISDSQKPAKQHAEVKIADKESRLSAKSAAAPPLMRQSDSSTTREENNFAAVEMSDRNKVELKKEANVFDDKAAASNYFSGRVMDSNNQPLANAVITLNNDRRAVTTATNGYFNFKAPDTVANVTVNSVGYSPLELTLRNNVAANDIKLSENKASLGEVVVVGYGTQRKRKSTDAGILSTQVQDATPVVSMIEYNDYIEKNKKVPESEKNIHGQVVVSFMVSKNGELSKFKIESSLSSALDKEAIRLIKDGPQWKLLKDKKAKAMVIVKF